MNIHSKKTKALSLNASASSPLHQHTKKHKSTHNPKRSITTKSKPRKLNSHQRGAPTLSSYPNQDQPHQQQQQHQHMSTTAPSATKPAPSAKFQPRYHSGDGDEKSITSDEFSCDKSVVQDAKLFKYLSKYGRHSSPIITALRKDTLINRQHIISMLLEPTTCSVIEWQAKAMGAMRILEVGTFTGVTATALGLAAHENYQSIGGGKNGEDGNWLDGLVTGDTGEKVGVERLKSGPAGQKLIAKQRQSNSNQADGSKSNTKGKNNDFELDLATVTQKEVILYDEGAVLATLASNVKKWDQKHKQEQQNANNQSSIPPPIVITLDRNVANIDEITYKHWDSANLVGNPLLFIAGTATETLARMTRFPSSTSQANGDEIGAQVNKRHNHHTAPITTPTLRIDGGNSDQIPINDQVYGDLFAGTFDLIFVDADKKSYPMYYEQSLQLLKPGGIACFDNVLWKGEVCSYMEDEENGGVVDKPELDGKKVKTEVGKDLHDFNVSVHADPRVQMVLLPIGDGLTMIRKL